MTIQYSKSIKESFVQGSSSVFDLFGTLNNVNLETPTKRLNSNWKNVGLYIYKAIEKYEKKESENLTQRTKKSRKK